MIRAFHDAGVPAGVIGPFYNDEFGDTFGTIFAFSGDGFSPAELKKIVEDARQRLLQVIGTLLILSGGSLVVRAFT